MLGTSEWDAISNHKTAKILLNPNPNPKSCHFMLLEVLAIGWTNKQHCEVFTNQTKKNVC